MTKRTTKKQMVELYKQISIDVKLKVGKREKKIKLTRRSPLRSRKPTLDCSAIKGEEERRLLCYVERS